MRKRGLSLSGLSHEECFTTPVQAMHLSEVQSFACRGGVDVAFVCVKSYDTEWATMLIKDYLAPPGSWSRFRTASMKSALPRSSGGVRRWAASRVRSP